MWGQPPPQVGKQGSPGRAGWGLGPVSGSPDLLAGQDGPVPLGDRSAMSRREVKAGHLLIFEKHLTAFIL